MNKFPLFYKICLLSLAALLTACGFQPETPTATSKQNGGLSAHSFYPLPVKSSIPEDWIVTSPELIIRGLPHEEVRSEPERHGVSPYSQGAPFCGRLSQRRSAQMNGSTTDSTRASESMLPPGEKKCKHFWQIWQLSGGYAFKCSFFPPFC